MTEVMAQFLTVTQWPRNTRAFWSMTRRFKPAAFVFGPPPVRTAQ